MRRKISLFALVIYICLVSIGIAKGDSNSEGSFAPLSPEFQRWQAEHTSQENTVRSVYGASTSERPEGYIPLPVDFSHLSKNLPIEDANQSSVRNVKANSLPSAFDLRNVNGKSYISSVKDQESYGTCWSFAALGSMESNYMMQGNSEIDLSEMHVAYFTYKNADKSKAFGNYNTSSFITVMGNGGNSFYPTALFARLEGPTSESNLPYWSTEPSESRPESYPRVLRLREVYYLSMNEDINVNSSEEQRNIIKRRIMQNGSISASYYNSNSLYKKVATGNTSYHTTATSINHAIQIVGWDDNYPAENFRTRPSIDGAWLIKNSWGDRWYTPNGYMGDSGYFWMSYETYLVDGASFIVEDSNNDMNVYEYDPLGICSLWGYGGNSMYAANVFESTRDESLIEVGIYTADNNIDYEIKIYSGMSSMPSSSPIPSGRAVSSSSGSIAFAGYHTITLDTPVSLSRGEYFSVVVKFKGYGMVPVEKVVSGFSNNAKIEAGSFFSSNGTTWATGVRNGINACIKAFTVTNMNEGTAPKIYDGYPPDGELNNPYSATLLASGTQPITWSLSRGTLPSGLELDSEGTISGVPTEVCSQTFTVKASNAYGSDTKNFTMNIWNRPSITNVSFDGYVGYAFSAQLTLNRTIAGTQWQAENSMPQGLRLNTNTGEITGTPTRAGEYNVLFKAATSLGDIYKDVKFIIYDELEKPVISTRSLESGYVGREYSQEIVISGTKPMTVTVEGLPKGLNINYETMIISGRPEFAGKYSIKITVENLATTLDNKAVTKTLQLEIREYSTVIKFEEIESLPDAIVGKEYTPYKIMLSSGAEPIKWKASSIPAGMRFSDGILSGTPTKAGNFKITFTASNSYGRATLKLTLKVLQLPVINTTRLSKAITDKSYSAKFTAKGTTPISWNISGLPETFTYSANKTGTMLTIKGTATAIASHELKVTATNEAGSSSVEMKLDVEGVVPKISASLGKGTVGTAYNGSKISAKGTKPITFAYSISESDKRKFGIANLEDIGLAFSYNAEEGTAEITGSPTKSIKSLPITITAENDASKGKPSTKIVKLNISGSKPVFTEPSDSTIYMQLIQKAPVSVNFTVTGTPDITFSMSKAAGFTLTQSGKYTATLTGTAPSKDGRITITVTAANADGKATRKVVIQTFTPPKITTSSLSIGTLNKSYSSKLTAIGTKKITWTVRGQMPLGIKFSNGTFSGKPKEAGTFKLSVTATNDIDNDTKDLTLTITAPGNVTSLPEKEPVVEDEFDETDSIHEETEKELESKPEHAITLGHERDSLSLSAGQSKMLSDEDYVIAAVLPEITVSESAMYDIDVELDENAETGAKLFWFAFPKDSETTSDDEIAEFYDESGAEIESVPESRKIRVSVWLTEGVTYEPVIAVKD